MTESASLWSLVVHASWMVQFVLVVLLAASLHSWATIIQKTSAVRSTWRASLEFEGRFWSGVNLGELYRSVSGEGRTSYGTESVFVAGFREFSRLTGQKVGAEALIVGVERAMRIAVGREQQRLESSLTVLATIGSTAPYIGLFGTVVGVMNAFRGLALVQQSTLAAVAPGIAEALVTTAVGLIAAIPAVIAYNRCTARIETLLGRFETFAEEFTTILHRQAYSRSGQNSPGKQQE